MNIFYIVVFVLIIFIVTAVYKILIIKLSSYLYALCSLYFQVLLTVTNESKEQQKNHQRSKNSHWNAQKETTNRPAQKTTTPQQHTILTVQYHHHHQTKHAHHTSVGSTKIYGTGSTQESREQWWSRPARPRISGLWSWKVRRT